MNGVSVDFHDQEAGEQEIDPTDAGQEYLGVECDAVTPEKVLCVDFHYRFRP